MVEIWYALLCLMLAAFAILDGWNIGAGAVHLLVARSDAERRAVVSALGPLWSWHEVWLIAAGGVLFLAFPSVLASAFSGFYLALFLLLWSLILRGIALELGGHLPDYLWRSFWDVVLGASSALLAILLGAALGNVIRGVPLEGPGRFSLPFFTDFGVRGWVGILDWYTLSVAIFTLLALAAHGASYLAWRSKGALHERCARLARRLWPTVMALLIPITAATSYVRPEIFAGMARRPAAWLAMLLAATGSAAAVGGLMRKGDLRVFLGGCAFLFGLLGAAAAGLFPVMLYSTLPETPSMTAFDGASGRHGLSLALVWWPAALAISIACALFVARRFRGKVDVEEGREGY